MIEMFQNIFNDYTHHPESLNGNIWIDNKNIHEHLLIPVYSYIKPIMGTQSILPLLLSISHFATEIDLTLHKYLREPFRYTRLIGSLDDLQSITLKVY